MASFRKNIKIIDKYFMTLNNECMFLCTQHISQSAACDQPVFINSSTAVSVTCHAENVYPSAQCQLINYSQLEMSPYVIYNYIPPTGEPGHVNMWCTFQWALKNTQLSNATIVMAVKMLQLRMFETQLNNISLSLYLPNVELKSDCFKYSSTTCTCALTSAGSPPAKAVWSSSKSLPLSTVDRRDGSSQLTLPPRQPDFKYEEYYCTAASPIGQHSEPVIYEPKYFSGPNQIYIEVNTMVDISTTTVQVHCLVPKVDTFPGVSIKVNVGDKEYRSSSIEDDGVFYKANFTFASETFGSLVISCTARNMQNPTKEAINRTIINIPVIPENVQIILLQSNSTCHTNAINITCSVIGKNLHSGVIAVLFVDSEIKESLSITERSFNYTMVYRNESSGHGALEISCVVRNTFGYHVVPPRRIIVKNENECSENTLEHHKINIVVGVIFSTVAMGIIIGFIVIYRRHKCRGIPDSEEGGSLGRTVLNPSRSSQYVAYEDMGIPGKTLELSGMNVNNPSRISQAGPYEEMKCIGKQLHKRLSTLVSQDHIDTHEA